jgi:hypothetical protein
VTAPMSLHSIGIVVPNAMRHSAWCGEPLPSPRALRGSPVLPAPSSRIPCNEIEMPPANMNRAGRLTLPHRSGCRPVLAANNQRNSRPQRHTVTHLVG